MASAATHRLGAALTVGMAALMAGDPEREPSVEPFAAGGVAYLTATLPDILEPASNPHHRKFFHSLTFGGLVAYGIYKAYQWNPETPAERWLRLISIAAGGAYLVHLLQDAGTPKGLPVI